MEKTITNKLILHLILSILCLREFGTSMDDYLLIIQGVRAESEIKRAILFAAISLVLLTVLILLKPFQIKTRGFTISQLHLMILPLPGLLLLPLSFTVIFFNSGFRQDYIIVLFSVVCIILYLLFVISPWFYSRVLGILHDDAAQQSYELSMDVVANAFVNALLLSSVVSNAISLIAYFIYPSDYFVAVPDKFNYYIILSVAEFFILGGLYYMVNKYPVKINFSHTTLYSVVKLLMKILGFYVIFNHFDSYFKILLDNPKEYLKHLVETIVIAAILLNPDWLLQLLKLSHKDINKRQLLAVSIRFFAIVIIMSYLLPGLYLPPGYFTNNNLIILVGGYIIVTVFATKISELFPKLE